MSNVRKAYFDVDESVEVIEGSDKDKDLAPVIKQMKSSFEKPDLALIVDGHKLFINKAELVEKSPVFKTMFTADFKEKHATEIPLPDKDLYHFLMFLRCTLDGYKDEINDKNVHFIIPIAHEYQVQTTLNEADLFLSKHYKDAGFQNCSCQTIVDGIVEAEKFGLTETLNTLIDLASRKKYSVFSAANGFVKITDENVHAISMTRWKNDIDANTGTPSYLSSAPTGVKY